MPFYVGQKVICVDAKRAPRPAPPEGYCAVPYFEDALRKGAVYTIREIDMRRYSIAEAPTIRLEEIAGPIGNLPPQGPWEYGFNPSRFRPEKTTSIEVFRKMLVPTA